MFTERIMITFELNEDDKSVQWNETLHDQLLYYIIKNKQGFNVIVL